MTKTVQATSVSVHEAKALAYARRGIFLAILSGIIFSLNGIAVEKGKSFSPFSNLEMAFLIPFICGGVHDFFAGCIITVKNAAEGRLPELGRSLVSRPGRSVILGAMLGATFGMGGYMTALQLAGPAYVLPITSLYPAVASVLAVFVLKERIRPLAWIGLAFCVVGAIVIGYESPSSSAGNYFYIGLLFAALAAVGWGAEGVCATSGMDFIDPIVALNIYYIVSTILFWGIFIPSVSFFVLPQAGGIDALWAFFGSSGLKFIALAGTLGAVSYACWYKAMAMTGVSRAMAINISYALWGIVFSALFTEVHITVSLIIGAIVIFAGMVLVIGNPKDILNLRKVE